MRDLSLRIILRFIADQFTSGLNAARRQLLELSGSAITSDTTMGRFHQRINVAARSVLDFGGALRGLIAGFSLLAIAAGIKGLITLADNLRLVEGRIKSASNGAVDFARNYAGLVGISFNTGTALAENANMFSRINAGMRDMGGTARDSLRQVDLVTKGLRLSNAGTGETASVIRQWSQAIASGLLRGDEFNSMMENAPRLAEAMADGLGVNIGVLRAMAEAGELTSAKVVQALVSQGKAIDEEFKKLPVSIGAAFEKIKTAFGQYVAEADRGAGATAGLADGMESIANNMAQILDTAIMLAKMLAIVFAGAAISGIGGYLSALWAVNSAERALANMTRLHTEALREDLQRTAQLTGARVQQIEADIAATRATLAGTLSMGERMAVTDALNLQTQSLTAATLAQTEANAALSASTASFGARIMSALTPMNLLNLAMALMAGRAVGEWLNSFTVVKKGAIIAIDAMISALARLEYEIKKVGLRWEYKFTFSDEGLKELEQKRAELDAEFAAGQKNREETKQELLDEADAAAKTQTEVEKLVDSFKNAKTPQDVFKDKARELTRVFNEQKDSAKDAKLSLETYTLALQNLYTAMQTDLDKQKSPFEKMRDELQDRLDKAVLSPEAYQRKQLEKQFGAAGADELMPMVNAANALETAGKDKGQSTESLVKTRMATELAEIKQRDEALKTSHELEIKQLESTFKTHELSIKQQGLSEIEQKEKLAQLAYQLTQDKLKAEHDYIIQSAALDQQALTAKIKAAKAEAAIVKPGAQVASIGALIAGGESGASYNAYNKGTQGGQIIKADKPVNLEAMTIAEIQARQALDISNADRLFAVGKYQVITSTLKEAVEKLKISADAKFDAATQEKIFTEYLIKTPAFHAYVSGQSDDNQAAQLAVAQTFRAVADPRTGLTYADKGQKANKASVSTPAFQAALPLARKQYQQAVAGGADDAGAFKQAVNGFGGIATGQTQVEKIRALEAEQIQGEQDKNARLQALGFDAQNAETERDTAELEQKKSTLAEQKALKEEQLQAEHDAALDAIALKEEAANTELALGNITDTEHLQQVRDFAEERLKKEQWLLNEKAKLYQEDKLALAQNLADKARLEREAALRKQQQLTEDAKNQQAIFDGMMGPFKNAVQQMTNGVLTGQQTISNAVKNAANSMLVTYASTFIRERALQVAHWAWKQSNLVLNQEQEQALKDGDVIWPVMLAAKEKAILAAHWTWEQLGFAKKETTKQTISQHSLITETLLSAKKRVVSAAEWAWETVGFGLKEAKKRAISLATNAWETLLSAKKKIVLAAEWVWESLGFGAKEVAKTGTVVASQAVQTGAQLAGDAITTTSHIAATKTKDEVTLLSMLKTVFAAAKQAAAFTYQSVSAIPFVGWALAPAAAAVAFAAVMALGVVGSAEKGEMEVEKDGSPFILHRRESVLPTHVADNFRKVVDIVKHNVVGEPSSRRMDASATGTQLDNRHDSLTKRLTTTARTLTESARALLAGREPETRLPPNTHEILAAMRASGQLKTGWTVPAELVNLPQQSAAQAASMAQSARAANERQMTERLAALQPTTHQTITHHHEGDVTINAKPLDGADFKKMLIKEGDTVARVARDKLKSGKMLKL